MKRKWSTVWFHFSTKGEELAVCRYCKKTLSFKGGASGNLSRHLKMRHPEIPLSPTISLSKNFSDSLEQEISTFLNMKCRGDVDDPKICTIMNPSVASFSGGSGRPQSSLVDIIKPIDISKSKMIDEQLVMMMVKGFHPFSLVENDEFKNLVYLLCPGYKLPSKKILVHSIFPSLYETAVIKIKDKLKCSSTLCLSADAVTSTNNVKVLAITVHVLDDQLHLCSYLLGCLEFNKFDTGKCLSNKIIALCKEWDIENKIEVVVTGLTGKIVAAFHDCGISKIACFAHTINMFVQTILKRVSPLVDKVRMIVRYFRQSSVTLSKLQETQKQMHRSEIKLKKDVMTCWRSTYEMLLRILKNKEPLIATIEALQLQSEFIISDSEWKDINSILDILSVFRDIILEIRNEITPSLSKTLILTKLIISNINKKLLKQNISYDIKEISKKHLLNEISRVLLKMESNDFIAQATFLDPRFKNLGFLNDIAFNDCKQKIVNVIQTINIADTETPAVSEIISKKFETNSVWSSFDVKVWKGLMQSHPTSAAILEVDGYIKEPLLQRTGDPLIWWKQKQSVYPRLYSLFQKRSLPATSVPWEHILSKEGSIAMEKRNQLSPKDLSKILFLNHNVG